MYDMRVTPYDEPMIANFIFTELHPHYPQLSESDIRIDLPPKGMEGHYTLNVFSLAGKCQKRPDELAREVGNLLSSHAYVMSTEAVKGFLNITFSDAFFIEALKGFSLPKYEDKNETVVIDHVAPNIGKPLHIGHICALIFGQVITNGLKHNGYTVISDAHIGDWGIIFGKLITAWQRYGDEGVFKEDPINHLLDLYVRISSDAKDSPETEQACRDAFRLLSESDPESIELWKKFTHESMTAVQKTFASLLIDYDFVIGESFYEGLNLPKMTNHPDLQEGEKMDAVVNELIEKGIVTRNEDGSAGVEFSQQSKLPSTIVQKRDGANMYITSDFSTLKYRSRVWSPSKIIICTGAEQKLHMQQIFNIAKRSDWGYEDAELTHVMNGLVKLPEGKISSRSGNTIPLDTLVAEGSNHANKILEEKGRTLAEDDVKAIAVGAIKYAFVSQDRSKDIVFTWDKALAFEGNSGPYIQYAIVRMKKLLENLGDTGTQEQTYTGSLSEYEVALIKDLLAWKGVFEQCLESHKYHSLAQYCYEVATHINSLYSNVGSIADDGDEARKGFRNHLISEIVKVLETSFEILGLPIPNEM